MNIGRVQIEGGFLDGFDVRFADGLNVLIGARGTGKTSVIELIRYALASRNHTAQAGQRSTEHAQAVLSDGLVTIEMEDLFDRVTVSRGSGDAEPRASGRFTAPLIFSQTEIEDLGLSESGRLKLLDSFIENGGDLLSEEASAVSAIRSAFKEIAAAEEERSTLVQGLGDVEEKRARIKELETQAAHHRAASSGLAEKQQQLEDINARLTEAAIREGVLERFESSVLGWAESIDAIPQEQFGPELWDLGDPDPLSDFRDAFAALASEADSLSKRFIHLAQRVRTEREKLTQFRLAREAEARSIRTEVEHSVAGAGAVARQLAQLRTEVATLVSRRKVVDERDRRIAQLRSRRDERIRVLDTVRSTRFSQRQRVAATLNKVLAPQIKVTVERYGQYAEYGRALTEALRGSGMRYNDLVAALTASVSPQELIQFVDNEDFIGLSDIAGIPKDRSARLLAHLKGIGGADIVTVSIEDNVRMMLLDGVDYKDVEYLSAGQRCTVILSIVLQHSGRTLIIDQPEDHLDNAYIASTVIKAIRNRKQSGQLIISTHNANIPVLGEADLVVEMTSDGRNGFVQICEKLISPKAVEAITNVMEGGRQAFADRAAFYDSYED